ncbi:MAG: class C sortase [Oscillospiraceae bacterium]|nr:class C sortase [Oscillospiraceae bacterium]
MKRNLLNILLSLAFLIGIGLLLYPSVSNFINSKNQTQLIDSYNEIINSMSEDEHKAAIQKANEYNAALAADPNAFYQPDLVQGYTDTLDTTGTGIMGYVTIDKIKVELPIYHGVDDNVLQIGAGHLEGTSLPVGGTSTHAVLSGHRGLPSSKLFTDLDKLEVGDTFYITVLSDVLTYQVDQIRTVYPNEIGDLQITNGKDYCTLFTCTPYGINTHRLLIRGKRIQTPEDRILYVPNEAFSISRVIVMAVFAIPMSLILLAYLLFSGRRSKKKRNAKK